MKQFWNERYSADEYVYGELPNEFFKSQLINLQPGKLLLPGEGEGRNAVWAAKMGWKVDAVDYSESAKVKALSLAAKNGVTLESFLVQDLEDLELQPESYDAIALIFIHLVPELRSKVHQIMIEALKPNGMLMIEAFHPEQLNFNTGGPKNEAMLYTTEILSTDFAQLKILQNITLHSHLHEGAFHEGLSAIVRFVATKVV